MIDAVSIGGRPVGPGQPPFIVAELSGNHRQSIDRALALVEAAGAAGADAVKLQTYTADTITLDHPGDDFRIGEGPWAGRRLHDLYDEAHTPWDWHPALFGRAWQIGLRAFSTPFDPSAVDFLESLEPPAHKIASFELVDLPLIARAAATGRPLVLSTGMASVDEIDDAVAAARSAGCRELILLHCVSGYPTPTAEANLRAIPFLRERYQTVVGLSDHSLGVTTAVAAVALGAAMIEKHLTLSRADGGPDGGFSLEPAEFARLCTDARTAWEALGRRAIVGSASEAGSRLLRRSLYVVADLARGATLGLDNVRSIRPAAGLAPKHLPTVLGRRVTRAVSRGTPLTWELIGD